VNIENSYENYFIDESDALNLLSNNDEEILLRKDIDSLNLKELERRLKTHHFVDDAQVGKDLRGNLLVNIIQSKPLARIIFPDGPHAYISNEGKLLSTSGKYTARVLIIDGVGAHKLMQENYFRTDAGIALYNMLKYIDEDKFLKAQIAQINLQRNGDMVLIPQIGKEKINIGDTDDYELKFENLKIFYKNILPVKGWNTYEQVKLKFKNQIVCEKSSNLI
jgi:cell division protein FtsQ